MLTEPKGNKEFSIVLEIAGVSPQDAGSYRVTAKNDLGESNATIGLNFDGRLLLFALSMRLSISLSTYSLVDHYTCTCWTHHFSVSIIKIVHVLLSFFYFRNGPYKDTQAHYS